MISSRFGVKRLKLIDLSPGFGLNVAEHITEGNPSATGYMTGFRFSLL